MAAVSAAATSGFQICTYFLIHNGSSDNSLQAAEGSDLPIEILRNSENIGFGAACNQAFARSQADFILLLNPDTQVAADSLTQALACMQRQEHQRTGILGIQLQDGSGQVNRSCARFPAGRHLFAQMTGLDQLLPGRFPGILRREWDHLDSQAVDHVMGSFYLLRREVLDQVQGFDPRFFMYLEDLDFSLRVSQAGWGSYYLAEAQAYHHFGGASQQIKAIRLFYYLSSRIRYANKHLGSLVGRLHLLGTLCLEPWPRAIQALLRRTPGRLQRLAELFKAYRMLWKALPNLIE